MLHGFSDASEIANVAYIYLLSIDGQGKINTKLLLFKSRVPPTPQETIPAKTRTLYSSVVSRYVPSLIQRFEEKFQQVQILDGLSGSTCLVKFSRRKMEVFCSESSQSHTRNN